ncbi:unnamed protein product [Arabidopsis halleri]
MAMEEPSTLFSSLPNDIVLNVLARVPRRYHPILSCVSKKLRSLVRSSELHKTRSLLGKDCFYVCFKEFVYPSTTNHYWFTLTENRRLVSIPSPSPPEPYAAALMVGPEIYFVAGSFIHPSRNMWILDPLSGKLRQGPSRLVATLSAAVGLVDDRIYVFGGGREDDEIQAQVFDLKTQTWQVATNPSVAVQSVGMSVVSPSLDRKIYARNHLGAVMVYDPRDGQCDFIRIPDNDFYSGDLCVIDNVIYMHYLGVGLMWYNSKTNEWRVVHGLELNGMYWKLSMVEYNGKLAYLWHKEDQMEIWCTMILLYRSGVEIHGQVEWSNCVLSDVPRHYNEIKHYLGRTD